MDASPTLKMCPFNDYTVIYVSAKVKHIHWPETGIDALQASAFV